MLLGIVVTIRVITDRGQTKDRISVAEAENELEEVTGVSLKLDGAYLTYADMEEVLERLHLNDYITYEKKSGAKKVPREEIYDKILDYLDSEHRIQKESVLVLGVDEKKKSVDTSIGSFSLQGITLEEMKQYRLYVTDQKILGIVKQEKKSESTLANVYLKSLLMERQLCFFVEKNMNLIQKAQMEN